ncbi:unnamed protein product [Trichobilharzia szidati]|nr:unnamed protein product [Trichobilharzia szidati]
MNKYIYFFLPFLLTSISLNITLAGEEKSPNGTQVPAATSPQVTSSTAAQNASSESTPTKVTPITTRTVTEQKRKFPIIKFFWNDATSVSQTKWSSMWSIVITSILYLGLSKQ